MSKYLFKAILFLLVIFPYTIRAQADIQEIIQRTDTIQDLHKKASSFLYLAEYHMQDHPDSAIVFADRALEIALATNDSLCLCDAYMCLSISHAVKMNCTLSEELFIASLNYALNAKDSARIYSDMAVNFTICGDPQKAVQCNSIASKIYLRLDDKFNLGRMIINQGVLHSRNAKYYQATECYHEALIIFEEIDDQEVIAGIYQNMGEVMALQKQYDKAVGYYNSALNRFEEINRYFAMAGIYLNLGQIYIEQKQWDVAKHYLNKSYIIDTTYKFKNHESIALHLLGVTYLRAGKLESAEMLIGEALRMQKTYGYNTLMGETTNKLAEVYYEQEKYAKALRLINTAEELANQSSHEIVYANILSLKALILAKLKQYDSAYFALKESQEIGDSIYNLENTKNIMNLELAYQTEKKVKQIDELKFNDTLRKEQLAKKNTQVYLLIVSVILLLVTAGSLLVYWTKRQQADNQKRERRFLQGRFEAEEKAKDEIARELHDDIGGQLIGIILQLQSSQNLREPELKHLQNVYRDVRRLSHSLDEPLFKEVTLQGKIRNYLSELKDFVSFKSNFIDDITRDWQKIQNQQELQRNIYRIFQELVTNTIKFANASQVDVQLLNEDHTLVMIYEDDGVGFSAEKISNNRSFNTIRKRVEMFEGNCEINAYPNEGVFVKITIPFKLI